MNIRATSTNFDLPIDRLKNRKYFGGWSSLGKLRRDSTTLFAAISQVSACGTYNMHAYVCGLWMGVQLRHGASWQRQANQE